MAMSTQTLAEGAFLLSSVLIDTVDLYMLGEPTTQGIEIVREQVKVTEEPIPALVQGTSLTNAVESATENTYSIKVARGTQIEAGMAVKVVTCVAEPELVGRVFMIDKVSLNGAAMIRKAIASDTTNVNQEGKEGLS